MSTVRSIRRSPFSLLGSLIIVMLVVGGLLPRNGAFAQGGAARGLSKHDRALIADAQAQGKSTITLLIAAKPGSNKSLAGAIAGLGGTVRFRDDDIGYLRVAVGIGQADAVARLNEVQAIDVDEIIPLDDPQPEGAVGVTPQPAPGASTPNNNAYMPIGDIGAAQFMAANPGWDGRGVTVGIMDSGVDLAHPALQTTTTGERKIIDWVTYTHPTDDADPTWVSMQDQVSGASFTYQGLGYAAPAAGAYRIGLFNERDPNLGGEIGNDVNRDGNPAGSSGVFAVLWNTASNTVYVDANQNRNFADDMAMTDYGVRFDINYFGTDNPATDIAERMPFVVQTDGKNKFVNIGIVSGAHGSHVAGIVAANGMFGGAMTGAAPGARLKSVRVCLFVSGCTAHALIEGMTWLAKQGNVDVINMSIGGLPSLNDGNTARTVLYDRLIEQYNVHMFISAGNSGPGINTIGDPSVASKVISVGAYVSQATLQRNYGSDSAYADNLNYFTSRGPREDGGFKPQIIAPGSAISTIPTWQPGGPVAGTFVLPAGYAMFNGTSMASPQAAGGAALLVSAAKQTNVQKQPAQLRQAINSSARYIERLRAFDQGNGLFNVGAAWNLLKTNIKTVNISSSVAVNTVLSAFLATPGFGQGIYDREGVSAGQSYTREYTFTRTSGGGGSKTYNLSWTDNDGTFSAAGSLVLPLNTPTKLLVSVNPTTAGEHAAILNLDDPGTTGIDYQTMNVVIAAEDFTAANNYTITKNGSVGRNQSVSFFFRIPAGTPAFKVDFSGPSAAPGTGQARFLRWHPYGVGVDSNASTACYIPAAAAGCAGNSRTASNPQAGVWEVTVDARRTSDAADVPFTLTASILGASVAPNPDVLASAAIGAPVARSYTFTNLFGAFIGRGLGTGLGSARRGTFSIANLAQQQYSVAVTAGSTSLRATIGGTSDPAADLDLFVYNCTSGTCVLAGQSADGDSEESVTVANPAAGAWLVVIDGYAVPAGNTTYTYVDVFANAAFGSISVTDANALRPASSAWTAPATLTVNAAPASGRVLLGNVLVRADGNITIGSGDVVVESVTP
ncbi:MAG TPA: S8 family serine peptidase [Herpetosiphonaceae bacterium]|nr:S8 family serine peptidase [Herpetosiphonaceae bacterium]